MEGEVRKVRAASPLATYRRLASRLTGKLAGRSARLALTLGLVSLALLASAAGAPLVAPRQATPPSSAITYAYDELGRLVAVSDPANGAATYGFDAVGNLLSIARQATSVVSVLSFSPQQAATGSTVTIYGTGFSATPSQDTVTFNGTTASVTSATATQLVVTAPAGATSGPIAVRSPTGSATSASSFTVGSSGPSITSFTPTITYLQNINHSCDASPLLQSRYLYILMMERGSECRI